LSLTSAQIVALACQGANVPGWTAQGGQLLNEILSDLCYDYDLALARQTFNFNFNPSLLTPIGNLNIQAGNGPYVLPSGYLRAEKGSVKWFLLGVPYDMVPIDIAEFDSMVEQAGNQSYPFLFATDLSQEPPIAYVWPPASGAYPAMIRYFSLMPDIGSGSPAVNGWNPGSSPPGSSSVEPWFPKVGYLRKMLTAKLRDLANDPEAEGKIASATEMLRGYLINKDDDSNRAKRITLDARRFRRGFSTLRNTKSVGWVLAACAILPLIGS